MTSTEAIFDGNSKTIALNHGNLASPGSLMIATFLFIRSLVSSYSC